MNGSGWIILCSFVQDLFNLLTIQRIFLPRNSHFPVNSKNKLRSAFGKGLDEQEKIPSLRTRKIYILHGKNALTHLLIPRSASEGHDLITSSLLVSFLRVSFLLLRGNPFGGIRMCKKNWLLDKSQVQLLRNENTLLVLLSPWSPDIAWSQKYNQPKMESTSRIFGIFINIQSHHLNQIEY